ncbi:hypothetical protein I5Q34_32705 [Streptomyces sp. AV19]|uniref:Pycsar system effector family protein n=1 Tax=Streptomyces sp. AV19 TaxID=2793068 RepID=UPI0018FE3BAF|nr:Pycsar system effector family protein [Streptomyces sp. AV19]MBH1938968.1 hypothetical protein [Streptomyces sp. AV19]MDG4535299.1 DUF5706 domain-containing protein [Streptomyces sp. AV19]
MNTEPDDQARIIALRNDIARVDTKASVLLALASAALAAVLTATTLRLPGPATWTGAAGAAAFLAATLLLLLAVRPSLHGPGWPTWDRIPEHQLAAELTGPNQAAEARTLATLARRKYLCVRAAVDLIVAGTILLTAAGCLTAAA